MKIDLTDEDTELILLCIETELNAMTNEDKLDYGDDLDLVVKKIQGVEEWKEQKQSDNWKSCFGQKQ